MYALICKVLGGLGSLGMVTRLRLLLLLLFLCLFLFLYLGFDAGSEIASAPDFPVGDGGADDLPGKRSSASSVSDMESDMSTSSVSSGYRYRRVAALACGGLLVVGLLAAYGMYQGQGGFIGGLYDGLFGGAGPAVVPAEPAQGAALADASPAPQVSLPPVLPSAAAPKPHISFEDL